MKTGKNNAGHCCDLHPFSFNACHWAFHFQWLLIQETSNNFFNIWGDVINVGEVFWVQKQHVWEVLHVCILILVCKFRRADCMILGYWEGRRSCKSVNNCYYCNSVVLYKVSYILPTIVWKNQQFLFNDTAWDTRYRYHLHCCLEKKTVRTYHLSQTPLLTPVIHMHLMFVCCALYCTPPSCRSQTKG